MKGLQYDKVYVCVREFATDGKNTHTETITTTIKSVDEANERYNLGPIVGESNQKDRAGQSMSVGGCRALLGYYPCNTFKSFTEATAEQVEEYKKSARAQFEHMKEKGYHMTVEHLAYINSL